MDFNHTSMTSDVKSGIALYARKSSESEDRQILSIESQVRELKEFASREHLLIADIFTESKSAKAPGRPVFNQLLKQVNKRKYSGILCWKLDRLARNPVDGGALIWAMEEQRLAFIYSPQRTFSNTGNDKFWMQLDYGMAKKYVDDLSDNVKRGLRARLASGWASGLPPLGYLNERNTGTIVKDPDRFQLVRRMWDLLLSGKHSPPEILEIANSKWGFRTRQLPRIGDRPLSRASMYKIFGNPFYHGAIRVKDQIYPGRHDPMISKSEFDRAQGLLHRVDRPRPSKHRFAFRGLLKCGECGGSITAEHKYNAYRKHYVYYHCYKKPHGVSCSQGAIEESILEGQIIAFLESLTITDDFRRWVVALLRELHAEESEKDALSVLSLNRRYAACKDALAKLLDLKLKDLVHDEEYIAKRNQLENGRFQIKELLEDADDSFSNVLSQCESTFDFAATAKLKFLKGTDEEKRSILSLAGSQFILQDGILHITPQRPLQLLQSALASTNSKKADFELSLGRISGKNKGKSTQLKTLAQVSLHWRAVVDALRTFYRNNPTLPTSNYVTS